MSNPSVMHDFSRIPKAEIPRSTFDRSHGVKTTFDAGYLIPILCDEALPGDTISCKLQGFGRLATPLHPFMDNLFIDTFFFFVPNRLVWDDWEKFNGEQDDPGDSTDYLVPVVHTTDNLGYFNGDIGDYFGLPTEVPGIVANALHFRAYNLIWNEWFRDQNLQDSVIVNTHSGADLGADYAILPRGKRHDYFTSCLPWPQKGPSVELPLGTSAPVISPLNMISSPFMRNSVDDTLNTTMTSLQTSGLGSWVDQGAAPVYMDPNDTLITDLTQATASTVNELRQSFQIQRLYERDARGGTRYTEIIKSHFGVTSDDARLQRPEYLGGGSTPINVNPVAQTSETSAQSPQANLAAIGTLNINDHGFNKSFTEHGVIIGLVNVRADLNYQDGINRMWTRQTRFDYYWPALSHIGEQAVLNKELYAQGLNNPDIDEETFGYQERYAEYRYKPSTVTGQFRSNFAQTLDAWHLAQDFQVLPALNENFIVDKPPVDRVIAVTDYPHILFDGYYKYNCTRPMPAYSVPGMIDHF